jgi:membrane protein YdbS with pleckstrin-like domain
MVASTPGDLQHMGRSMLDMFVKMLMLAGVCGTAAVIGWIGYLLAGESWFVALGFAWLVLFIFDCAIVPCIAWAYNRFDVSMDTPA